MEDIELNLTERHMGRLRNGHAITVKPSMIGSGMKVKLHPDKVHRLKKAMGKTKGVRLAMTEDECKMTGGKLTWRQVKKGLKAFSKGYKKYAKPIVSPIVKAGIKLAAKEAPKLVAMAGAPELAPAAAALGPALEEAGLAIGKVTGAYSVKKPRKTMKKVKTQKIHMSRGSPLPASHPLVDVGNVAYGTDFIKGMGMKSTTHKFNTNLADPALPASDPIVDVGSVQYGSAFLKGVGYGVMVGNGFLRAPRRGGLLRSP